MRWAGYDATRIGDVDEEDDLQGSANAERRALARRALVSAALSLPVVLMAMVPGLQFDGWQWLACAFTIPVVGWAGLPFHRAALRGLRHGTTTMPASVTRAVAPVRATGEWTSLLPSAASRWSGYGSGWAKRRSR